MTQLVISPRARINLRRLIETHSLPTTTTDRFQASIQPLAAFPLLGQALGGRWTGYRYLLGPWRWMIIVYEYHEDQDLVAIVTIQDARSERSPAGSQITAGELGMTTDEIMGLTRGE